MAIDLVETIQQHFNYPALQKVDPNTQQPAVNENNTETAAFSQAAIPAVLTGLYKYAQTDEGSAEILQADPAAWIDKIFDTDKKAVIQSVSAYCQEAFETVESKMNAIAKEAVKLVKENLTDHADIKAVKLFFSNQRNHVLLYLPPALKMGGLLHDDTLDDATNKMEGPVSSLIKNIGAMFSSPVTDDEIKKE